MKRISLTVGLKDGDSIQQLVSGSACLYCFLRHSLHPEPCLDDELDDVERRWLYNEMAVNKKMMALDIVLCVQGNECTAYCIHRVHRFCFFIRKKEFWSLLKNMCNEKENVCGKFQKCVSDRVEICKQFTYVVTFSFDGQNLPSEIKFWTFCLRGFTKILQGSIFQNVCELCLHAHDMGLVFHQVFISPSWLQKIQELCSGFRDSNVQAEFSAFTLQFAVKYYIHRPSEQFLMDFFTLWTEHLNKYGSNAEEVIKKILPVIVDNNLSDMFTWMCHTLAPCPRKRNYPLRCYARKPLALDSENTEYLRFALQTAITAGRESLVSAFLNTMPNNYYTLNKVRVAADVLLQADSEETLQILPDMLPALQALRAPPDIVAVMLYSLKAAACNLNACNAFASLFNKWLQHQDLNLGSIDSVSCYGCLGYTSNDFCSCQVDCNESWVSNLATWCSEKRYFYLAVFLSFIWQANLKMRMAAEAGISYEIFPTNWLGDKIYFDKTLRQQNPCTVDAIPPTNNTSFCAVVLKHYLHTRSSLRLCQDKGLFSAVDWAMVLFCSAATSDLFLALISTEVGFVRHVLDFVLKQVMSSQDDLAFKRKVADQLLSRFHFSPEVLRSVVRALLKTEQLSVVDHILSKVHPACMDSENSSSLLQSLNVADKRTLLHMADSLLNSRNRALIVGFMCLCISSGMGSHQRHVETDTGSTYWSECLLHDFITHPQVIDLLVRSGCVSHKALRSFCSVQDRKPKVIWQSAWRMAEAKRGQDESLKLIHSSIINVGSLLHLARLVVSDALGCQPGRKERIQSLPVPDAVKDFICFKDVIG